MTMILKAHDGSEHDFDALPPASRVALANRGFTHVLKNEVASMVTQMKRKHIGDNSTPKRKADSKSIPTAEVQAFTDANPKIIEEWTLQCQNTKLAEILNGELGVRSAGTAVDPLTREMLSIARQEIKDIFRKQGWSFPTKADDTFTLGDKVFTGDELVEAWLDGTDQKGVHGAAGAANKPRIEREATRSLKAKADKRNAVAKATVSDADVAASLGLSG